MTDLERLLCSALNLYCFQHIWNEPVSEFRTNVRPYMLSDRSQTGRFNSMEDMIPLPNADKPFYVYAIPSHLVHALQLIGLDPDVWYTGLDLCNTHNVLCRTYHRTGRMFHQSGLFFRWSSDGSMLYVAISKAMALKLVPYQEMKDIYLTFYHDSTFTGEVTVYSYQVPFADDGYLVRNNIHNVYLACSDRDPHTTVYVNGYETVIRDLSSYPLQGYVDIVCDEDVVLGFEVDLTQSNYNVAFHSEMDQLDKQIVHIPKDLNSTNRVLTHHTWDIHVRERLPDGTAGKGLYLHRVAERGITQLTHNDIGIPLYILDAFRDHLQSQNIILKVIVRQHAKDNVLLRDKSYIDLLYTHSDADIMKHFQGKISKKLPFWKAVNLEQSAYVKMMSDTPNTISPETVWEIVEGLGYYHTLTLLCQRTVSTVLTDWFGSNLIFAKPYLFANQKTFPVVYLNGWKVRWQDVIIRNNDNNLITIGLADTCSRQVGDKLTVEMFLDGPNGTYKIVPASNASTIELPFTEPVIYEAHHLDDPLQVAGIDRTANVSYVEFQDTTGNLLQVNLPDGGCRLTFGPMTYGRTFYIQNKVCVYKSSHELDDLIQQGNPLVLPLDTYVVGQPITVPIFKIPHLSVYLNGRYLVPNVDYRIHEFYDWQHRFSFRQLIVQNLQYLQDQNNFVEILVTGTDVEADSHGYLISDRASTQEELTLYFDNISTLHLDGLLEIDVLNYGDHLKVPDGVHRQGAVFEARTCIPKSIKGFLDQYHPNDDYARLVILNEYFHGIPKDYPDIVVVSYYHKIYSLYTALIIRDLLNGTLTGVSYDPDQDRMREQLKDYLRYRDMDLVHQKDALDLRFVDLYPHYKTYTVPDIDTYRTLQAFIKLTMPEDTITSGDHSNG